MTLNEAIAALKQGATELTLQKEGFGVVGAIAIASELETNNTLVKLILVNDDVGDAGAIALAKALEINTTLVMLNLRNTQISDAGATAIAKALEINTTLEKLYLSNDPIHDAGFLAIATALETNTTLTSFEYYVPDANLRILAAIEALARIETLVVRNQLLRQLASLRQQLAVGVTYQSADPNPITEYFATGEIKQQQHYFNVTRLFVTLTNLHQIIEEWATSKTPPRPEDMKKLRNDWRAMAVLFHLRCVDTPNDASPIDNIHPQVAAAEQCLAQMDIDSDDYREACYQLGRYYFQRAAKCFDAKDHAQGKAFAKTSLNYLHVCKQDPNFKEADTQDLVYDDSELPSLISYLVTSTLLSLHEFSVTDVVKETKESVQSKQTIKDYTIHMPNDEDYDRARNLEVPGAKTVPTTIRYDEAEILASLNATAIAAEKTADFYRQLKQTEKFHPIVALDNLLKLLDEELASANQLAAQPTSLLSNVSGFFKMRANSLSPQQIAILQARAIQAIRNALIGKRVEGNFVDHIVLLKNSAVIDKLNLFIAAGHAKVGGKKVETLEEFVVEITKKNTPELKK